LVYETAGRFFVRHSVLASQAATSSTHLDEGYTFCKNQKLGSYYLQFKWGDGGGGERKIFNCHATKREEQLSNTVKPAYNGTRSFWYFFSVFTGFRFTKA